MSNRFSSDHILFGVTLTLLCFGLLMVYSSSAPLSTEQFGSAGAFFWRQAAWAVLGVAAMLLLMRLDYHHFRSPAVLFTGIFLALLMLAGVLWTAPHQQTNRWLRWGAFSLQPSEFAKLTLVIFLAYWLEKHSGRLDNFMSGVAPALCLIGVTVLLILREPDLGTPIAIVLVSGSLFFIGGLPVRYFLYLPVAGLPAFYELVYRVPYRRERVLAFLNPHADPLGSGFQIIQSLISVGTGGVSGLGLMNSRQKLFFLPAAHTDFIFAVTAEELGLIGAVILLALFVIYFWRGWRSSLLAPDDYGCYLAAGLTLMIFCQTLINISVVLALLPAKGLPLPFFSYGGSSLFFSLAATGILLNISRHAQWGEKIRSVESVA